MSTGNVTVERQGHVLLIGIDRAAKRNAFDLVLWEKLCLAYGELARDDELRAGVLHAHGDHFTGGLDLAQWSAVFQAGKFPVPGLAVYNASKFAVVGLTAATRLEMAPHGVTLTAILPSAVDTDLASGFDMKPIPKVRPGEIADAVVGSVRSRAAEIAVPRYVGALAAGTHLVPVPLMDRVRKVVRGDRALHPDTAARAAYTARLDEAAHANATSDRSNA